jgi:hypothetical protein
MHRGFHLFCPAELVPENFGDAVLGPINIDNLA